MQGEGLGLDRPVRSPQIYENLHLLDIMTVLRKTRYLSHDLFLKMYRGKTLDPCLHSACFALADPAVTLVWSQTNHHNIA